MNEPLHHRGLANVYTSSINEKNSLLYNKHISLKIENNSFDIFDSSLLNSFDTIRVLLYFFFAREQQIKIKIKVNIGVANYTNFEVKDAKLTHALIPKAFYLYYALF